MYECVCVRVQVQAPAYVSTKMSNVKPSLDAPTADNYVKAAVRHIGYEYHAVPYFKHALDRYAVQTISENVHVGHSGLSYHMTSITARAGSLPVRVSPFLCLSALLDQSRSPKGAHGQRYSPMKVL
jgi:hypothetical protein